LYSTPEGAVRHAPNWLATKRAPNIGNAQWSVKQKKLSTSQIVYHEPIADFVHDSGGEAGNTRPIPDG
jgi:hypothetical protein